MNLYTQLNFGGNCEDAFRFYTEHLDGTITMVMRQNEAPGASADAGSADIVARMAVGNTVLIANDVPPEIFKPVRSAYRYLSVSASRG